MLRQLVSHRVLRRNYSSLMSSSEALVETLKAHNVRNIFGIVGSAFMNPLHSFPTAGIKFISVQHEQNAVHMADGYARSTGNWGVCIAQNGPGITNMVTGVATAYYANSPVVFITPQASNKTMGLGMFQEIDQMPLFSKITKYQVQVNDQSRIAEELSNCFHYSRLYNGPAQLNIPREFLYGDAMTYAINGPKNISIKTPGNPSLVNQSVQILSKAKNPMILVGGGINTPLSRNSVIKFAEKLGAGVATTYLHNDSFPCDHPLYCGSLGYMGSQVAMNMMSSADVVFAVGTRLSKFGLLPQYGFNYWPEKAKIIQVDINADAVGKTRDVDIGIIGDGGIVCEQMTDMDDFKNLNNNSLNESNLERISKLKNEWNEKLTKWTDNSVEHDGRIPPRKALRTLTESLPDNSIISTDIGNICSLANNYLNFKYPKSFLGAMTFGSCGSALPTAIGAKIANPEKPCVAIVGDGAWGMSFFELMTAKREKIPVIAAVFSNKQWGAEKKNQVIWFGNRYVGTNLKNPDFANVAKSMGCEGFLCKTEDDIKKAVDNALENHKSGKSTVIDIEVSRELTDPFRRDAMQLPKRYLDEYYEDNVKSESLSGQPDDMYR
jgi:sulfoacetaldehyde acetyltransferase